MKSIQLSNITPPAETIYIDRMNYEVFLGNGTCRKFTNRKAAEQFLAETNRFLTNQVMNWNADLTTLLVEYRRCWIYFRGRNSDSNQFYVSIENIVNAALADTIELLDYTVKEYYGNNHQAFIWHKLDEIGRCILKAASELIKFRKKRMEVYERNNLENLYQIAKKRMAETKNFGELEKQPNNP